MDELNTKRKPNCKFTISEEKKMIELYQEGNSLAQAGKQFHCDATTVQNILKAYNIQTRNLQQARRNYLNYSINEDCFVNLNNPDSAYWLGVMYSDGYISKAGRYTNYFGITVHEKDSEWLEQFKSFLQYNGEVNHFIANTTFKENTPVARLQVGNNKIVADLEKLGVVEHKTFLLSELPKTDYLDDFIRGYIDGDGSLMQRCAHITISGTKDFLLNIANYFKIPYKLYKDKSIYSLQYNAKESHYLEKRLYLNAKYALKRKYNIASRSFDSPLTLEDVMENSEYQGNSLEL